MSKQSPLEGRVWVRQGSCGFLKVLESYGNDSAISQELGSFGKGRLYQNGYGRVLDFCLEKF